MKPVDQQSKYDCLQACFASIFELPLEAIPAFGHAAIGTEKEAMAQDSECRRWLAKRGLELLHVTNPETLLADGAKSAQNAWGFCVGGGKSPRGDFDHAVVYEVQYCMPVMVHDPHASREGLDGDPLYYTCFMMVDPGKWAVWCEDRKTKGEERD